MKKNEFYNQLSPDDKLVVETISDGLLSETHLKLLSKRNGFYSECEISDMDTDMGVMTLSVTFGIEDGDEDWEQTDDYDFDIDTMEPIIV